MKLHTTLFTMSTAFVISSFASAVCAQTDDSMRISFKNDGNETVFAITDVSRITFDGDNIIVKAASGDVTYAIADIDKIKFNVEISAVDDIKAELSEDVSIEASRGVVNIKSANGDVLNVAVYNMQGKTLLLKSFAGEATLDFTGYNPGVYIIKSNNKVIKFKK